MRSTTLCHVIGEGDKAPDFTLHNDAGEEVTLSSLRGKPVVLYFYPKDDTPGCTTQACGIRDAYGEFERAGAIVLGISPDDESSHVKFRKKYDLPFNLLADTDHAVAEQYGTWGEKSYLGKTYFGRQPLDVRHRRGRHREEGLPEGQAGRACRRRARRARLGLTVMRMRGLEPPRAFAHTDLNRARLPIPPHPRAVGSVAGYRVRPVTYRSRP